MHEPFTVAVDKDIIDLAEGFLRNRRVQALRARVAVEAEDFESLRRIGHELKGTAGSYGFRDLSAIGVALEAAAEAGDLSGCRRASDRMLDSLDRVAIAPC